MIKLSIIIVGFRNMKCLETCLLSIPEVPWIETIVVDNTNHNRGFGAGCNTGAQLARGTYLLFLNPDCQVSLGALESMVQRMSEDESIGILGPKLTDVNGKSYLSCSLAPTRVSSPIVYSLLNRIFWKTQLVSTHWCGHVLPKVETEVGIVSGAVMLIRKSVFELVKGFDEQFFLYWEEVDLAKRIQQVGKRIVFYPQVSVLHEGELSTLQPKAQILKWFRETRYTYFAKHFGTWYATLLEGWFTLFEEWRLVLALGILLLLSVVNFSLGWWLTPLQVQVWTTISQFIPVTIAFAYWLSVAGAMMMMIGFFNEVVISIPWVRVLAAFVLGLLFVFLGPALALVSIIGGVVWMLLDLTHRSPQMRKLQVLLTVGLGVILYVAEKL